MGGLKQLEAAGLYERSDADGLNFDAAAELKDLREALGQPRALAVMQIDMGMKYTGYNVSALGPSGSGKRRQFQQFFEGRAAQVRVPNDLSR